MRYGLPYKGSKNAIAEWIVNALPPADTFVDLFCGGGAVTHYAMMTDKYQRFIMNDVDGRLPILFRDCAYGKYTTKTHPEWISREQFNAQKDKDAYIALVWSFGNNGKDYLYGADIEPYKRAYHELIFTGNPEPLKQYGICLEPYNHDDAFKRYLHYSAKLRVIFEHTKSHEYELENYERLQTLERLQSLYRLQSLQSLQSLQLDYSQVKIPHGALIYCDPPYAGTNCGKYDGFDHERFYKWALEQSNIFISEYWMPEPFIEVADIRKSVLSAANGDSGKVTEKLWTNPKTYEMYGGIPCDRQLSLF